MLYIRMNNTEKPTPTYDVTLHDRGRMRLPKQLRERYGYDYRLIVQSDKIIIVPTYVGEYNIQWIESEGMPVIYPYEISENLPRASVPVDVRDKLGMEYRLVDKGDYMEMIPIDEEDK